MAPTKSLRALRVTCRESCADRRGSQTDNLTSRDGARLSPSRSSTDYATLPKCSETPPLSGMLRLRTAALQYSRNTLVQTGSTV